MSDIHELLIRHATVDSSEEQVVIEEKIEKMFRDLQSALASEREKHKWIPVSEKLPENGQTVLILHYGECGMATFDGNPENIDGDSFYPSFCFETSRWWWDENNYCNGSDDDCPTHWQPLPEPPESEE